MAKAPKKVTAKQVNALIKAYIAQNGCGDPDCGTCKLGVAIGLAALDRAFNAGAKLAKQ